MKTVLFFILDQWADWEAAYVSSAIRMLGQNQFSIKTVSISKNKVESIGGFQVIPDYEISSCPTDYEALILIGGMSWRNDIALQIKPLVEQCLSNQKILGGICDATAFLGAIGALNYAAHTSNTLDDLKAWAGALYTNEKNYKCRQAVRDHNLITANGTAALEFAREILLALKVAPENTIQQWYHFHKLGCYNAPMPHM